MVPEAPVVPERELYIEDIGELNNTIQRLRQQWNDEGLPDEEFLELYDEIFDTSEAESSRHDLQNRISRRRLLYWLAFIGAILITSIIVTVNFKLIKCVSCTFQNCIYPGLRFLRNIFIPIICQIPSITRLYHETCLVSNPFYVVTDMDCWPCSSMNNIIEIPKLVSNQLNAVFIYKTEQEVITPAKLKHFYMSNKHLFDDEAPLVLIDSKKYIIPTDMISQQESGKKHNYVWEFNNVNVARLLRQIVPRPKIVPKFGQSIQRYIIVDTSHEEFLIPDTECNFSFMLALSGSRSIELEPSEECQNQCKTLKVELDQTYLLWYNWWYWRPVALPSTSNTTFIAHVGSYC